MVIHNQKHLEVNILQDKIKTEIHQPEERTEQNETQMKAVNLSHSGEKVCGKYFWIRLLIIMFYSEIIVVRNSDKLVKY